jgi:hypothetical protein
MGNTSTAVRESYSNTQELIEINKLSQKYLSILFKDDPHATRDYDESRSDFMFRSRPSMYLYDKLTFEQKKILVSEFYNINKELKNKLLNNVGKLKYLQQYEIAYTDCGGVSQYPSISLNYRPSNTSHKFNDDVKYGYSAGFGAAAGGGGGCVNTEMQELLRKVSALEAEVSDLKSASSAQGVGTHMGSTTRKATHQPLFDPITHDDNYTIFLGETMREKSFEQKNYDNIKRFTDKLVDWDNNICGGSGAILYGCKSPVYYKDMIEDTIRGISFDKKSLLTIINELYKDVVDIETDCYISKYTNEAMNEALLRLNEVFITDKYYKNIHIVNITNRFIPSMLGVLTPESRCGRLVFGVDNYIRLIKTRICIFQEFYSNI